MNPYNYEDRRGNEQLQQKFGGSQVSDFKQMEQFKKQAAEMSDLRRNTEKQKQQQQSIIGIRSNETKSMRSTLNAIDSKGN